VVVIRIVAAYFCSSINTTRQQLGTELLLALSSGQLLHLLVYDSLDASLGSSSGNSCCGFFQQLKCLVHRYSRNAFQVFELLLVCFDITKNITESVNVAK
jgi:hypothetical protein